MLNICLAYDEQSIPRYMCKKKDLFKNIYSIFIHNCEKLDTIQVSTSKRMYKQIIIYSHNEILLNNEKERTAGLP